MITFARFYSLHILIFPALTIGLIALHLHLIRRHGVTPNAGDIAPKATFYPQQVFRDVAACSIAFTLLFAAAAFLRVPLERLADPTDASYVPRPEWYFLFLFQALKFFQGSLEPVGSIGLPTLAIVSLFCLPFLDRSKAVRLRQRTIAISVVAVVLAGWSALTAAALRSTPRTANAAVSDVPPATEILSLSAEEMAGIGYFRNEHCEACHNLVDGPPKPGPTLALEGKHRSAGWMIQHFKNPSQTIPGSNMPPILLRTPELNALSAFLLKLRPETAEQIGTISPRLVEGAEVFVSNNCGTCHKVNDVGGDLGPRLNGISSRRSREWIEKHFENPQALSPGSTMPPFHFQHAQQTALVDYLLSLP